MDGNLVKSKKILLKKLSLFRRAWRVSLAVTNASRFSSLHGKHCCNGLLFLGLLPARFICSLGGVVFREVHCCAIGTECRLLGLLISGYFPVLSKYVCYRLIKCLFHITCRCVNDIPVLSVLMLDWACQLSLTNVGLAWIRVI